MDAAWPRQAGCQVIRREPGWGAGGLDRRRTAYGASSGPRPWNGYLRY